MYPCKICEKSYSWPHDLNRYVKHKHYEDPQKQQLQQQQKPPEQQQEQERIIVLKHPFTMIVSGPTSCGKTHLFNDIVTEEPKYMSAITTTNSLAL